MSPSFHLSVRAAPAPGPLQPFLHVVGKQSRQMNSFPRAVLLHRRGPRASLLQTILGREWWSSQEGTCTPGPAPQEWGVLSANFNLGDFFFFKEKYEEENNTRVFPTMWNHEANILLHLLLGILIVYICKVTRCPLPLNFFLRKMPNTEKLKQRYAKPSHAHLRLM